MLFWLSMFTLNLIGVIMAINSGLWHFIAVTLLISMFMSRARLGFNQGDPVYWYKPDVTILLAISIYVLPTLFDALLGRNTLFLEYRTLFKYCILIVSFVAGLYVATSRANKPDTFCTDKTHYQPQRHFAVFAYFMIAVGVCLYLYMILSRFGSISNLIAAHRLEFYKESQDLGIFLAGLNLVRFGWIYLYILHLTSPHYRKKIAIHFLLLAGFSIFFLAQGERGIWVKLLVGIIFIHLFFHKIKMKYVVLAMILGTMGLQLFSKFRIALDSNTHTMSDMFYDMNPEWLNMAEGETGAHFTITQDVLNDPYLSRIRYGRTYLHGLLNMIPKAVWPTRDQYIDLPHTEYMLKYHHRFFYAGGGKAYSFFLEAYINFWYLGPPLVGFLMGLFFSWFYRICVVEHPDALKLTLFASSFGTIMLLVRSTFAAFLKAFMLSSIAPFLFFFCLIMLGRLIRRNTAEAQTW